MPQVLYRSEGKADNKIHPKKENGFDNSCAHIKSIVDTPLEEATADA